MEGHVMLETTAVALAEFLAKNGHAERAAGILNTLITSNPQSVSLRSVCALARIVYEARNWADAATLWRLVAGADPNHVEALVNLAHCLKELDQHQEADECIRTLAALAESRNIRLAPGEDEAVLARLYEGVCLQFISNRQGKAEDFIRLASLASEYAAKVVGHGPPGGPARALSDGEIRDRLDTALSEWERGGAKVQYVEEHRSGARPTLSPAAFAGKKVLLVLRQYFLALSDSREHEVTSFFRTSAQAVGLKTTFFAAEPFLNPKAFTPEHQYSELDRLARLILSERPDVVIFDDVANQNPGGEYLDQEVYRGVFGALKQRCAFKLVGFYPDAWTAPSLKTIEFTRSFLDVVWHQNLDLVQRDRGSGAKFFCAPLPYPEQLFQVRAAAKDIPAAFVGSLFEYNYPRGIWLTLIKGRKLPCQLFLTNHRTSGSPAGATPEEYAAFMSRIRVSINFSARTTKKKIMTGRAWESIISRCLLLEEENEEIRRFFVPFVHYIPFRNIQELESYLGFFQRNETLRAAVADRGAAWARQTYAKEKLWGDLFSLLQDGTS